MKPEDVGNWWAKSIGGKPTAYAVYSDCTEAVMDGWSDATVKGRVTYYRNRIFPLMNNRPLEDFTIEDIDDIIEKIKKMPSIKTENTDHPEPYDPKTVYGTIVPCIARLFSAAEQAGICDDIFWEAGRSEKNVKKNITAQSASLPKSISPQVEKLLMGELMVDETQPGCTMGILLMFACGLRNAEACAATFGNIVEQDERYYLCSHSTVDPKVVEITIGGKTYNMFRIIPISRKVYDFLQKRKRYIQSLIDAGIIELGSSRTIKTIDDMPIVCSPDDFCKPCVSRMLTREGRRILHKVGYDYAKLSEMQELVNKGGDVLAFGKERCPTAYLFRRNFGEHLRDLGFTEAQIQYLMGHVIVSKNRKRNDFSNPDQLKELSNKMMFRPLLNDKPAKIQKADCYGDQVVVTKTGYDFECSLPCDGKTYLVVLESEEYHDSVGVTITPPYKRDNLSPTEVRYWSAERPVGKAEQEQEVKEVNVLRDYLNGY